MRITLERITQPDIEPVGLAEVRRHLRLFDDITDEDDDVERLITSAREWAEDYTGRALIDQTWRLTLAGGYGGTTGGDVVSGFQMYPGYGGNGIYGRIEWIDWLRRGEISLHKAPVIALTSFVSVDAAGVETAIDPTTYELREANSKWPRLVPLNGAVWPTGSFMGGLRVTFRAGFSNRTDSPLQDETVVPVRFRQAIKLHVEAHYDRDEKLMPLLLQTAEFLLKPERSELQFA